MGNSVLFVVMVVVVHSCCGGGVPGRDEATKVLVRSRRLRRLEVICFLFFLFSGLGSYQMAGLELVLSDDGMGDGGIYIYVIILNMYVLYRVLCSTAMQDS